MELAYNTLKSEGIDLSNYNISNQVEYFVKIAAIKPLLIKSILKYSLIYICVILILGLINIFYFGLYGKGVTIMILGILLAVVNGFIKGLYAGLNDIFFNIKMLFLDSIMMVKSIYRDIEKIGSSQLKAILFKDLVLAYISMNIAPAILNYLDNKRLLFKKLLLRFVKNFFEKIVPNTLDYAFNREKGLLSVAHQNEQNMSSETSSTLPRIEKLYEITENGMNKYGRIALLPIKIINIAVFGISTLVLTIILMV